MNKISLNKFISQRITGDWGNEAFDEKHPMEVLCVRGADLNDINLGNYESLPVRYLREGREKSFLKEGDIIIEISGGSPTQSTGRVGIIDERKEDIVCSNFCRAFRIKDNHSAKYFYYAIQNIYNSNVFFNFESKTTGLKNLMIDIAFSAISIPKFDFLKEKQIADILSSIDSKIILNSQINQQLEEMAKTIYDYWFVQFDFPNEEGKPYKSSGGKMVYNNQLKREIPEGWESPRIKKWLKETKSGDWGKETETGNYVVPVTCIRGADLNGLNGTANLDAPDRFILKSNKNKILDSHDLIIEISGGSPIQSTGRMAFLIDESLERFEHPLICSNFCRAASLKNKKTLFNFVFQWKHYYDLGVFFNWEGRTTGIKNLLFDVFISSHSFILPEENIMNQFYDTLLPMYKQIQKNLIQNQELASLRDWLLPMLMNGQVRVEE